MAQGPSGSQVLESRQPIIRRGPTLGENRRAVGVHVGVEDFQRLTTVAAVRAATPPVQECRCSADQRVGAQSQDQAPRPLFSTASSIPENDEPFVVPDVIRGRRYLLARSMRRRCQSRRPACRSTRARNPDQQRAVKPVSGQDSQRSGAARRSTSKGGIHNGCLGSPRPRIHALLPACLCMAVTVIDETPNTYPSPKRLREIIKSAYAGLKMVDNYRILHSLLVDKSNPCIQGDWNIACTASPGFPRPTPPFRPQFRHAVLIHRCRSATEPLVPTVPKPTRAVLFAPNSSRRLHLRLPLRRELQFNRNDGGYLPAGRSGLKARNPSRRR